MTRIKYMQSDARPRPTSVSAAELKAQAGMRLKRAGSRCAPAIRSCAELHQPP